MLEDTFVICIGSFSDVLDAAFRFYRRHFLCLWSISVISWAFAFALQFLLSLALPWYWLSYLTLFPLTLAYISCQQTSLITVLLTSSNPSIETHASVPFRHWLGAGLIQLFRLMSLVLPIALLYGLLLLISFAHRNDPLPMGSAASLEEQQGIFCLLVFTCSYPLWIWCTFAASRLAVPAIMIAGRTAFIAIQGSWNLGRTAFHYVLLASLLTGIIHAVTQLPTYMLMQLHVFKLTLEPSLDSFIFGFLIQLGLSAALPFSLVLDTFLYIRLSGEGVVS